MVYFLIGAWAVFGLAGVGLGLVSDHYYRVSVSHPNLTVGVLGGAAMGPFLLLLIVALDWDRLARWGSQKNKLRRALVQEKRKLEYERQEETLLDELDSLRNELEEVRATRIREAERRVEEAEKRVGIRT